MTKHLPWSQRQLLDGLEHISTDENIFKSFRSKARLQRGTFDRQRAAFVASLVADYCAQKNQEIDGLVIDLTTNANSSMDLSSVGTGTLVAAKKNHSKVLSVSLSEDAPQEKTKRTRKTNSQASLARLETKRTKTDYDSRCKAAFKDATNIEAASRVASDVTGKEESVLGMINRLNSVHKLDEKKKLPRKNHCL